MTILLTICMLIAYIPSVVFASETVSDEQLSNETVDTLSDEAVNNVVEDFMSQMADLSEKNIDFYSQRLIVKGSKRDLKDEPVIASLDGVSLLQYSTIEDAIDAYYRLSEVSDSVEFDSSMSIASGPTVGMGVVTSNDDATLMTEKENPFKEAEEAKTDKIKYDVAVIDTGANDANKVVSVLGDDGSDKNGHGQKMIDTIKTYAPDAKILSIKAVDNNGVGKVSAVYAAIKLAIDEKVDYINLSISALATEDNFIIEEVIKEAQSKGINVVGAAGNNGIDAGLTIPGRIQNVITVGTTNKNSNTGDVVDYYLPVESTSIATATIAGLMISDTLKDYEIKDKVVQLKTESNNEESEESTPTTTLVIQGDGGGGGSQSGSFSGGSPIADSQPLMWRWWDRYYDRDTQEPVQGGYRNGSWVNSQDGRTPIRFWIDLITEKYRTRKDSRFDFTKVNYGVPKGAASSEAKFKKAAEDACKNAIRRSGRPNATARIVAVAVTTLYDKDTNQWWFRGHAASNNWSLYHNMLPRAGNSSELWPWEGGWNKIVVPNATNGANGVDKWPKYVYDKGYEDVGDVHIKNGERFIVLAVTDDQPPAEVPVQIKKTFSNNAVVAGNPLYSLEGIVFRLYDTQANARANGTSGVKATLTINASGVSNIEKVAPGNYFLVEVGPPKNGVIIPSELKAENGGKPVTLSQGVVINVSDTPATGTYNVNYVYHNAGSLPPEVMATLPVATTAQNETVVTAANPSSMEIEVDGMLYEFLGWDAPQKSVNSSNITFEGSWTVEETEVTGADSDARRVQYQYIILDWPEGEDIPEEIVETFPVDMDEDGEYNVYFEGDVVTPLDPSDQQITIGDDTYAFRGWDNDSITVDENSPIIFTGTWEKLSVNSGETSG